MADEAIARSPKIPGARTDEIDQQVPFDVGKNTGWPQPTTRKKSDSAEVSTAQSRGALAASAEHP
jgi:hypothetical protein